MAEYIERNALIANLELKLNTDSDSLLAHIKSCGVVSAIAQVKLAPSADVAPVRHGRWVYDEENECWVCSDCEMSALNNYRGNSTESNYCPNCGAKMQGGENEK